MAAAITELNRQGTPIAVLRDKRDVMSSEDDLRLDDYLNDKLQSVDDLQDLDSLIASVEKQRSQLQGQLQDAQSKLIASREAASQHTEALLAQTTEFRVKQAGIDRRLAIVTASDAPDEAVHKFKAPIEKLRKLDLANYYVELLQEVNNLAEEARTFLPGRPKEALKPYAQLKDLALRLRQLQAPAEEAAGHLVNYVERRAEALWAEMEHIMLDDFDSILKKSDWPTSSHGVSQEWRESFSKLLELQTPEIMNSKDVVVLLPMAALAKVFVQQFRYHFMGSKATNSKLHPDYFLEWIITLVEQREAFLYDNVQPILVSHFRDTKLASIGVYVDPVAAFITALLPVLREKISSLLSDIQREPAAFSNFMVSLMRFDEDIRAKFNYDGGLPREGWRGLTWEVLDVWFSRWLTVEKEFAISRYKDIIKAKDSFKIDYDSTGPKRTKYTYGAPKVTDLIGTITTQYQSLKKFEFKLRFLIDIQLAILDEYHSLLKDSLDAYVAMTSTVGRALHGVTKEQQAEVAGTKGLERLCKVYGSSEHVINTLRDWSNELFFVDLWNELQIRAKKSGADDNLAEKMSYDEVRSSTSAAVGSGDEGGLFDETISSFKRRRDHAERLMTESIKYALSPALRGYVQRPNWLVVDNSDTEIDPSTLSISSDFEAPLSVLSHSLEFLSKTLATAPLRRIFHEVLDTLQDSLWSEVLMREKFTKLGAAQYFRDLQAVWELIDQYIVDGSCSALGLPRLREAGVLLTLPETETLRRQSVVEGVEQTKDAAGGGRVTLELATEMVYRDNQAAKELLSRLVFKELSAQEARQVLERRQL